MSKFVNLIILNVFVLLLTTGCTTTEDANVGLETRYIGKPVDEFFIQHGPPSSKHTLDSGKALYVWAENPKFYTTSGQTNTTVNVVGDSAFATTSSTPSSTITVQCQVRILANAKGIIEQILSHSDTVGDWELSRCAEVFRIRENS